jgi:hypothetical protein
MLQTATSVSSTPTRTRSLKTHAIMADIADVADIDDHNDGSDDDDEGKGGRSKSRRELPAGAVATLKAWLLSPEHFTHPYPTPQDQVMLMQKTGIDKKQLKNWFTNARRRIWKPMLKKQLEQGKLTATGGGGVAVPGVVPGLMVPTMPGGMVGQPGQVQYQQAMQHQRGPPQQEVRLHFLLVVTLKPDFPLTFVCVSDPSRSVREPNLRPASTATASWRTCTGCFIPVTAASTATAAPTATAVL